MDRLNREYIDIDWVGLYNSEQFQQPDTAPTYDLVFSPHFFWGGGGESGGGGGGGPGRETDRFLMRDYAIPLVVLGISG